MGRLLIFINYYRREFNVNCTDPGWVFCDCVFKIRKGARGGLALRDDEIESVLVCGVSETLRGIEIGSRDSLSLILFKEVSTYGLAVAAPCFEYILYRE